MLRHFSHGLWSTGLKLKCSRKFTLILYLPLSVNLTIAHLTIALLGGNPEVGNSEYVNHRNTPRGVQFRGEKMFFYGALYVMMIGKSE